MDQQAAPQHAFGTHVKRCVATDAERRQIVVDGVRRRVDDIELRIRLQIRDLPFDAFRMHEIVGVHACEAGPLCKRYI
jgi:hypothetical protein